MNALQDSDGLGMHWFGRVWLNPPYSTSEVGQWLRKLVLHGTGTALVFARTETETFQRHVWEQATGALFLEGRLHFHYADGARAEANAGAPSVLVAYGRDDLDRLAASDLPGALVPLCFPRLVVIAGVDESWADAVRAWLRKQNGPVRVSDAYRHFARHPKARGNPNWKAKVRQKLAAVGARRARDCYEAAA